MVCGSRSPFYFESHPIYCTMSPMCMMFPSLCFDGFPVGLSVNWGEGGGIKATSNERTLVMRCNKKSSFFLIYNKKYSEMQPLPNVSFDCDRVQLELKDMNRSANFGSLTSMGIKIKWNYPLTNTPLSTVKRSTERYQIFLEFV